MMMMIIIITIIIVVIIIFKIVMFSTADQIYVTFTINDSVCLTTVGKRKEPNHISGKSGKGWQEQLWERLVVPQETPHFIREVCRATFVARSL